MATGETVIVTLGCDPTIDLEVVEDGNKLVVRLINPSADVDIDGLFLNLQNDALADQIDIWPRENSVPITGFDTQANSVDHLDNGATVQGDYDVGIQFGNAPDSTAGYTEAPVMFTIEPKFGSGIDAITLADLDLTNVTVVVNSDTGNGQALVGNPSGDFDDGATTTEIVEEVAVSEDFNHIHRPEDSDDIVGNDGWYIWDNKAWTDGCRDGKLVFEEVAANSGVTISFDAMTWNAACFENSGHSKDTFEVQVKLDDGSWQTLDVFTVNDKGTAMVGSETGQTFGNHGNTLTYEVDGVSESAQLRLVSDFTASNEYVGIDNVEIVAKNEVIIDGDGDDCDDEDVVIAEDDFDGIRYVSHAESVQHAGKWYAEDGKLVADGCKDGNLWFDTVETPNDTTISFDASTPNAHYFENNGWMEDSLEVWVLKDGHEWVLLDTFQVNDEGTALVGDKTGQTITSDSQTISYSGGELEGAKTMQLVLDADFSASNEQVHIDNLAFTEEAECDDDEGKDGEEICEDFSGLQAGDDPFDAFENLKITATKAGATQADDAMIFDTENPTGWDYDLGFADQGNAIIISEDGDAHDPDDNAHGGTISFEFTTPSEVKSLSILDVEEHGGTIDLFDADGNVLNSLEIPAGRDNSQQTLEINTQGVSYMDVNLVGSGAVDDLCYIPEDDCEGDQYDILFKDEEDEDADPYANAEAESEDEDAYEYA
ncbi:hypothetical protein [Roseivivax sp. THAF30]|uniref:hypothetical protein n=1 Tax=Roseivivax sp. THAF30 TaxID=2587852 RepID=UPI001268E73C|nr:hypothetical protein [Roseivivax sp. THAF30]QFT63617.1 hypothetical protein FIU91_11820 [Roseivivax sp. THAF30]